MSTVLDDDERSAKDLWTELDKAYRMSNTQMAINTERKLENMTFDKKEWEKHLESFHLLVSKLASIEKPVSSDTKVSKILRTFPQRSAPIAMVAESSSVPFEMVIPSVKAEISRRKVQGTTKTVTPMDASALHDPKRPKKRPMDGSIRKRRASVMFSEKPVIFPTSAGIATMQVGLHVEEAWVLVEVEEEDLSVVV